MYYLTYLLTSVVFYADIYLLLIQMTASNDKYFFFHIFNIAIKILDFPEYRYWFYFWLSKQFEQNEFFILVSLFLQI